MIPVSRKIGRPAVAASHSIPAPVGGWNARDSIANMDEKDAIQMINMVPNTTDVQLRLGSSVQASGIAGWVETLAVYANPTKEELFACTAGKIYNVTFAGPVGAPAVSTGITSGKWQHVNFGVPGGAQWLMMVNGADSALMYDGSAWSNPTITGVATSSLVHVNVFKRRIWFVQKDSTKAWYLATDSIQGAATSLDLGPLFTLGGSLVAMATWTLDAGQGLDDHAVFISSEGQVAVYAGTDPSNAATFSLVGLYNIGAPIGRRCFVKFGGDLLIICRDGVMPLSKALLSSRMSTEPAITDRIRYAMSSAVASYSQNTGWQLQPFPGANMLILNVPVSPETSEQYVMNTINRRWCRFTGWNAHCWALFNNDIYFGTNGKVLKAWDGHSDEGTSIKGNTIPAFSYFGSRAWLKRWTMARPILTSFGVPSILMGINVDYDLSDPSGTPSLQFPSGALWDVGVWDASVWGGQSLMQKQWQAVHGVGVCASFHLILEDKYSETRWMATDFVFEKAGRYMLPT